MIKPVSPWIIMPDYRTMTGLATIMVFLMFSIVAFVLSIRCYPEADDTPIGLKLLFSLLAAGWNVIYLVYYFVTIHIFGMSCG